ncbi:MAG: hypothetical protein L6264_09080 [Weeksellaceae bacterium]|nr:hypothetical protein [Bacteroidota bacterium]MCG2781090.1 hypothetical protein [Weeksellaceae bacterium]
MSSDKKQQIITAFENLDSEMLASILDEKYLYQGIPKSRFVDGLERHFAKFRNGNLPFTAYPANVPYIAEHAKSYCFINGEGFCYLSLLLVEKNNEITDISLFYCSQSEHAEITSRDEMRIFYLEDYEEHREGDKMTTAKNISDNAVAFLENRMREDGFLRMKFYRTWYLDYLEYFDVVAWEDGNIYSFEEQFMKYIWQLEVFLQYAKKKKPHSNSGLNSSAFPFLPKRC